MLRSDGEDYLAVACEFKEKYKGKEWRVTQEAKSFAGAVDDCFLMGFDLVNLANEVSSSFVLPRHMPQNDQI